MSEQASHLLPNPSKDDTSGDSRRAMNHNLPPFNNIPSSGSRNFSGGSGFDSKTEQSHGNMMSKFPPNSASGGSSMPAPSPGSNSHEYGGQQQQQGAGAGGQHYNMNNNSNMAYWPNSNPNSQQNSGQVPFPNQQNPSSHLPSLYGNMSQPQNYYPPRPASGNPMPRAGSPHAESGSAPLPPPQQMHEGYNGQQQPASNNPNNYPMYVPQYGNAPGGQQGPTGMYGGPSGGYGGGYPQPYGGAGSGAGAAGQPGSGQYGGMYQNQMPHSREGSQDTQWQRSPYGPGPSYNAGYNGQYAPSSMPAQQSPYTGGRAGRGASNTGERPFKCDQCPQSFQRSHDLKRHKRIHLAIKPFPCPSCDKSFSRKDALKRHILVKGCGNTSS